MSEPLLVVDAPSLLFRAFYALPDSITDGEGRPVNALLGTTNLILLELERRPARAVVLCFGEEAATYRTELYEPYHADREPPPDALDAQFAAAPDFFDALGWTTTRGRDVEPDDVLGSLAQIETEAGGETLILTGDRDMFQCASDSVTVLYLRSGSRGADVVDPDEVRKRYGVPRAGPRLHRAARRPLRRAAGRQGDRGEDGRRPAAPPRLARGRAGRVGRGDPARARRLHDQADELRDFKDIATLRELDLERPPDRPTDLRGGAAAARKRGMNRLAERLEKLAATE